jgi:hypothetical protein
MRELSVSGRPSFFIFRLFLRRQTAPALDAANLRVSASSVQRYMRLAIKSA